MARKVGYLYKTEKGIDDAKLATRITLGVNLTTTEQLIGAGRTVFAKVTALRADTDDKQATAVTVVYNATTRAFETDDDLIFDSDNATADRTTTDIFSSEAMEVDQVLKIIPYGDSSEAEQWMAEQSGSGATLTYIEITGNTDANTYEATSFDNPVDRNVIETGLVVKAIQHTKGTLPNSAAGKGYFAITSNSILYIQPSIFSGA